VTGERRKPECTMRTTALPSTEAHGKEIVRLESHVVIWRGEEGKGVRDEN
jgi:hypothetical protein